MSAQNTSKLLTKEEVAHILRCSKATIDSLIKKKKLKAFKMGRRVLIKETDLYAAIEEMTYKVKK